MKNVLVWLALCLMLALISSGCALGMGQRMCKSAPVPERPLVELCISNGSGGAGCFDPRTGKEIVRPSIPNYVCASSAEYQAQEEWVNTVLRSCRP